MDLNLSNHIHLLGNKDRNWVYEHLAYYDLFIHPSRREGFGLSLAEAMAAGLPVIASNCDGPLEILDQGRYGMLFENGNAGQLAEAIETMITRIHSGEAQTLAKQAREHCIENYSIARTATQYLELYQTLIDIRTHRTN